MCRRENASMKNKTSRELFDYWNIQRGARRAPSRSEIDPAAIRGILGDAFMLTRAVGLEPTFRLAGTRICDMFGRELKDTRFFALWDARSVAELRELFEHLAEECAGAVAGVIAEADDDGPIALEMLLLPLHGAGRVEARSIGTLAPLAGICRPTLQAVSGLSLQSWRLVGPQIEDRMLPRFSDIPSAEVRRSNLTLHLGGRR